MKKSTSHLLNMLGPTHPGRPANEDPHVKKTMKGKTEKIELICRIDQDELGFNEDDFDDMKALFLVRTNKYKRAKTFYLLQLFDFDQDGVVSMKEAMGMLRCVGFRADEEQVSQNVYFFLDHCFL